MVDIAEE